ncbi:MAG: hypothetical protein FRX49_11484 [Trebouxia sp. A1-2]|nr:MAG: hypothetical protein FRX49_11484 [Trebouxia sp. A1-2]
MQWCGVKILVSIHGLLMKTIFLKGVTALLVLGALADVRVDSRRLRIADVDEADKIEHHRTLAEVEVHQQRERLALQN